MPLVGERPQALGEQHQRLGLHRQLAFLGGHHHAADAEPISNFKPGSGFEVGISECTLVTEHLNSAGHVLDGEEDELAKAPSQHHPACHRNGIVGDLTCRQICMATMEI